MGKKKKLGIIVCAIIVAGLFVPQNLVMPVSGATNADFNHNSFWYYPWGKSVTHKGVDIFAREGTEIYSSTSGIVLYSGKMDTGGNIVLILGPKWRLHYYAHMNELKTSGFSWAGHKTLIGTVGTSGNAKGKPPHLYYTIITIIPYVWRIDSDRQGWKKMFVLNPIEYLKK